MNAIFQTKKLKFEAVLVERNFTLIAQYRLVPGTDLSIFYIRRSAKIYKYKTKQQQTHYLGRQ